jgi:hypothetical protein
MKHQTRRQLDRLIAKFPAIGQLPEITRPGKEYRPLNQAKPQRVSIRVQRADAETMLLQASNTFASSYIMHEEGYRGIRRETVTAITPDHRRLRRLFWQQPAALTGRRVKDIFTHPIAVDPEQVGYLLWVSQIIWHSAPTPGQQDLGVIFGDEVSEELLVLVFLPAKAETFAELAARATREQLARDEAYLHPPQQTPELSGLTQALRGGHRAHAFRSGGGLRVVNVRPSDKSEGEPESESELVAYGEHPHIEEALAHAAEDYLAGHRPYEEVYGPMYPHYWTGASLATSNIDAWVLQGSTFDLWWDKDAVVCQLGGWDRSRPPVELVAEVIQTDQPVLWSARGVTYRLKKQVFADGTLGHSMELASSDETVADPWMYRIAKTGRGLDVWQAIQAAFAAEPVEVSE